MPKDPKFPETVKLSIAGVVREALEGQDSLEEEEDDEKEGIRPAWDLSSKLSAAGEE